MTWSFTRIRQRRALPLAAALLSTGLTGAALPAALPAAAATAATSPKAPAAPKPQSVPVKRVPTRAPLKDLTADAAVKRLPAPHWPETGPGPVSVSPASNVHADAVPRAASALAPQVTVTTYGRTPTAQAGVVGLLLSVTRTDSGAAGRVGLHISYEAIAGAVGGDWASRLRLVSMPACALSTPLVLSCRRQTPMTATNNTSISSIVVNLSVPATTKPGTLVQVLAVTAGDSGPGGSYTTTSLSPSAQWPTGIQSGAFTWTYPFAVPPAVNGPKPDLALSYSSATMDGRNAATNNQASWVGDGWDLASGYIERRYASCRDDKSGANNSTVTVSGDLCWRSDNASLVMKGQAGDLVKVATASVTINGVASTKTTWKLRKDDGSRVERFTALGVNADKDKEYWKLTKPDGTQYSFGLGRRYAADSVGGTPIDTRSAWSVPVAGNHSGEPCHAATFAASFCSRTWRWNLDYVVDPFGNSMTYFYQRASNRFGQNNNSKVVAYDRGGWLDHIDYGQRAGSEATGHASARVNFTVAERCLPSGIITCTEAQRTMANAPFWPDTPLDRICTSYTSCPAVIGPTFFGTKRLTGVTTQIWDASLATPAYADVDSWALTHLFPATGDSNTPALWLSTVARTGKFVGNTVLTSPVALPPVTFGGVKRTNRVPKVTGDPLLTKWRISAIGTETGSQTAVSYWPAECSATNVPTSPAANTKRCYPALWAPSGASSPQLNYFNRYPVRSITETDLVVGSPAEITTYTYRDAPAYHFDDNELVPPKYRTWGDVRGTSRVRVVRGHDTDTRTSTEYVFLRGMDQDCATASAGNCATRRSASVSDSLGHAVTDHERVAGWQLEKVVTNGIAGPAVTGQVDTPWVSAATGDDSIRKSYLIGTGRTETRTALAAGGARTTRVNTTFEGIYGTPTQIEDLGDTSTAGVSDDQCTRFEYARNTTAWIVNAVSRAEKVSVSCTAGVSRPADVISDVRTSYDGEAFGTAPAKGAVTKTEVISDWTTGPVYTTQSTAEHDIHGRATTTADALGKSTTTAYTPATGGPVTAVAVTDPKLFTTTTTLDPAHGIPVTEVDANDHQTDVIYDPLGRLRGVWLPGHSRADFPNYPNFALWYSVAKTAPTWVRSREMRANGTTYTDKYTIFDGMLRPRQVQSPAEGSVSGRVITETEYDSVGRVVHEAGPWWNSAAPSGALVDALDIDKLPNTLHRFDAAGRETDTILMTAGAEKWRTRMSYGGDRVNVTPPLGATPTTTISDARGRVTALRQYQGATPAGAYDETTYTYRPDGQRASVTSGGATWSYDYDLRGRLTSMTNPDRGTSTTSYDDANRVTSTEDARGESLFYEYDELDRRTAVRDGSGTGPVLASWAYDTVAKGKLTSATRFVGGNAYVQAITGYNEVYQPTGKSLTIPANESELAGTYSSSFVYHRDGAVRNVTQASLPGLPNETQTTGYNQMGNPITLASIGVGAIVGGTQYSEFGEAQQYALGQTAGKTLWQTNSYDPVTRRLSRIEAWREGFTGRAADLAYTYDPAGNLTKLKDSTPGQADTQCFRRDHVQRLTQAWSATDDCASAPSTAVLGGVSPYWTSWSYDAAGNRAGQVEHGVTAGAGDTTSTYAYPGAVGARPHAVQSVSTTGPGGSATDSYTYDASGNTLTRTLDGAGETLTWDSEGNLASHTKGGQTTSFLYDADGGRLIRREPGAVTLYLDNAELKLNTATNELSSTRYYVFNGDTVAVRRSNGTTLGDLKLLITDHQGTAMVSVDGTTQAFTRRRFTPFGEGRGTAPTWPGERTFLGGTDDSGLGTIRLGERSYDPTTGRFLAAEPALNLGDPRSLQGYTPAEGAPATRYGRLALFADGCSLHGHCFGPGGDLTAAQSPVSPLVSSPPFLP